MFELKAVVRNANGIHCRPSAMIVKACQGYPGHLEIAAGGAVCDPRSIMGLISLGLAPDTEVTIRVEGPDEAAFAATLAALVERHFDFPPRTEPSPPSGLHPQA